MDRPDLDFEKLFDRYWLTVYRFFLRKNLSEQRASDLAQDTFLQIWQRMHRSRTEETRSFAIRDTRAFVMRVAISVARDDSLRRKSLKRTPRESALDAPFGRSLQSPEEVAQWDELRKVLSREIRNLPPRQQRMLELYILGMKYREIAAEMSVSLDAVKTNLLLARRQLRLTEAASEMIALSRRSSDLAPIPPARSEGSTSKWSGADPRPSSASREAVVRVPVLTLVPDAPLQPGARFSASVHASDRSTPFRAPDTTWRAESPEGHDPSNEPDHAVDVVLLPSLHFNVPNPTGRLFVPQAGGRSSEISFEVEVKARDELLAIEPDVPSLRRGSLTAAFSHRGLPSGKVSQVVPIEVEGPGDAPTPPGEPDEPNPPTLRFTPSAPRGDLVVRVVADAVNDGRQFHCTVFSPLGSSTQRWYLNERSGDLVRSYLERFTEDGLSSKQRRAALVGAGRRLFDAAPENFRSTFWELVDRGRAPMTIAVVSEEPSIPWELMVPNRRRGGPEEVWRPLGVEFDVGRWVHPDVVAGPLEVPLRDSYAIVPRYSGSRRLPHAEVEAKLVCDSFDGLRILPTMFDEIERCLNERAVSLVHFACHGAQAKRTTQLIYLEGESTLSTIEVMGSKGFRKGLAAAPLVFLNACELGRPSPSLVGIEGFAATFVELGASAVIAPLWSVKDGLAHEVARTLYEAILAHPETPLATILRQVRARAFEEPKAEDTYLSYCLYGDPAVRTDPFWSRDPAAAVEDSGSRV